MDLTSMQSMSQVLARTRNGRQVVQLLRSLGFWSSDERTTVAVSPQKFPTKVSDIKEAEDLADASLYWNSELGRLQELMGVIDGEIKEAELLCKKVRNQVGAELLDKAAEDGGKSPKAAELKIMIEANERVVEADEYLMFLKKLTAAFNGLKSSMEKKCEALKNEQIRRASELKASVRYGS